MPTLRQKRIAKLIVENAKLDKPKTGGQMLEKVGYSVGLQKQPSRILESEGVKKALEEDGFTVENAKKVVSEILLDSDRNEHARLKAADMVFEVHGAYAPVKTTNVNLNIETKGTPEVSALREEFNKKAKDLVVEQIKKQ